MENQIAAPGEGFHVLTDCLKDEAKLAGTVQIIGIELFQIRTSYSAFDLDSYKFLILLVIFCLMHKSIYEKIFILLLALLE